jgi:hypothetical protein
VECSEAVSGGKRISSVMNVLMRNSIAKFGWVAYLINVTIRSHNTENTLHLLDKDQQISVSQGTACCFYDDHTHTHKTHKYALCVKDEVF